MKLNLMFILCFFITSNIFGQTAEKLDEKNGYKDYQFGKSYSQLKNHLNSKPDRTIPEKSTKKYQVTNAEAKKVSDYTADNVYLWFYSNKLYMIEIIIGNAYNSGGFLRALEQAYGKGKKDNSTQFRKYTWETDDILLVYDERDYSHDTQIVFMHKGLADQYNKHEADAGASDL